LLRERTLNNRQIILFSLVVLLGLLLTAFTAAAIYQNSVDEVRNRFQDAASRFLNDITVDLNSVSSSVTQFPQLFQILGEPQEAQLANFIDNFTAVNASKSVTSFLVLVSDSPQKRDQVISAISGLNDLKTEFKLPARTGEEGDLEYLLAYFSWLEREVSADGGLALLGTNLYEHEDYRRLIETAIFLDRPALALVNDTLSNQVKQTGRLVFASPISSSTGPAVLLEVVHLDLLVGNQEDISSLISEINVSETYLDERSGKRITNQIALPIQGTGAHRPKKAAAVWTQSRNIALADRSIELTAYASAFAYVIDYDAVITSTGLGLFITILLGYVVFDQMRRSNRVVEIVKRRTRALKEAHSELEDHYKLLQNLNVEVDEARRAAEAANMAKSEFLATMSHELRTPLNAILGFSEILESETLGPIGDARYVEYANDIHTSGRHLLSIINDILDLAKLEAGRTEIEIKPLDPRLLVERVVGLLERQAEEKGLDLSYNVSEDFPVRIKGDELRLRQVLINLTSNAIKFTPKGKVTVRAYLRPFKNGAAGWILEVTDTGIGIAEDQQSVLFDRFTQLDTTHSRRHGGVGLGLAICRELVGRMDGMIEVFSKPNAGTTITVQLPLDEADDEDDDAALI